MHSSTRLKAERERLGYNQTEFAALAGATRKTLFNWESGVGSPNVEALAELATHGVDIYYVITGKHAYPDQPVLRDQNERELVDNFRGSAEEERAALLRLAFAARYMQGDRERRRRVAIEEATPRK